MKKNYLFVILAAVMVVIVSCKSKDDSQSGGNGGKFVVNIAFADITGSSVVIETTPTIDTIQYAAVPMDKATLLSLQGQYTGEKLNKAVVATAKSSLSLTDQEFEQNYCHCGNASVQLLKLERNTEYAVIAFAYKSLENIGQENFVNTFKTKDEAPTEMLITLDTVAAYSVRFMLTPADTNRYFYCALHEYGYVEQAFDGGLIKTQFDFNETEIGMLEMYYYQMTGSEATPYELASEFMNKGVTNISFSGLSKCTKYTMIVFFYDPETDKSDNVFYRYDFTTTDATAHDYPSDLQIQLEWVGTTLKATPDDDEEWYLFDALPESMVGTYSVEELAEAVAQSYGSASALLRACSKGADSWNYDDNCYYYSSDSVIIGFAFGVSDDGKVNSQPVQLRLKNPYYGQGSYNNYFISKQRRLTGRKK